MAYNPFQPLQFQIPHFVCSGAPTLAPGGGAEVLHGSLLSDNTWFSNNGFTPRPFDDQYTTNDAQEDESSQQTLQQQPGSATAPFDFDSYIPPVAPTPQLQQPLRTLSQVEISALLQPQTNASALLQPLLASSNIPAPLSLGLPVYSASGFDLLSILARVANRPHPRVIIGPVDLTCSFVVVDVRRFDHPIVYCSPTFCRLTGYSEHEILGRNCRFLQAPNGQVQRGEKRRYTDQSAVDHLKKNLTADKECQTSIVNYKKDGTAFINLVTVIPILGGVSGASHEEFDVVYHVGFQVDLTEQPNAILEKLRDGSYIVDYASYRAQHPQPPLSPHNMAPLKDRKSQVIPSVRISRDLKKLLADPAFVKSIPITTSTTILSSQSSSSSTRGETDSSPSISGNNQLLHLMLLEASPDFILVVSLKGLFLYVAPSVRRVLGYEPEEMVGGSISDYAHPEDVVPLMRELKEGSATGLSALSNVPGEGDVDGHGGVTAAVDQKHTVGMQMTPRTVDLLFRARTKTGVYVWIECKGRLHVEPGKGRKAIVLSGRAKEMPKLEWHRVARGGGLGLPVPSFAGGDRGTTETEVWGMMSSGQGSGGVVSFLVVGAAVLDLLGWSSSELIGREVGKFIVDGGDRFTNEVLALRSPEGYSNPRRLVCKMRHKSGSTVDMVFILYRPTHEPVTRESVKGVIPAPFIYQLRTLQSFKSSTMSSSSSSSSLMHSLASDVFEELDTDRGSSWQYELQQIRFANQRLEDEIAVLTKQLEEVEGMQQKVLDDFQQTNSHETTVTTSAFDQYAPSDHSPPPMQPSPPFDYPPPSQQHQYIQHHDHHQTPIEPFSSNGTFSQSLISPTSYSREWDSSVFVQNQPQRLQSLKRSWDAAH